MITLHIRIRSLVLVVAVLAAVAVGGFLMINQGDEGAEAAAGARQTRVTEPQGGTADISDCLAFGVTSLLSGIPVGDYDCHADSGINTFCDSAASTEFHCIRGLNTYACEVVAGEAECSDDEGRSQVCFLADESTGVVSCENTGGGGPDYVECFADGQIGPLLCGTIDGPLVCQATPDDPLAMVCTVMPIFPFGPWGDLDCDGSIRARDQQALLRFILGNPPLGQTEPCPDLNDSTSYQPDEF